MSEVAREAYGARSGWKDSSLTAFAYMYRRFGPPPRGTDDSKNLAGAWIMKTRDPDIFLHVDPGGCAIGLFFGQYVSERLHEEASKPGLAWRKESKRRYFQAHPGAWDEDYLLASIGTSPEPWRSDMPDYPRCPPEIVERALAALRHALLDFLRPVHVRDVPINLFGVISPENPARGRVAQRSELAGWGVPVREMERRIREERRRTRVLVDTGQRLR
jgi:hypothetical protein